MSKYLGVGIFLSSVVVGSVFRNSSRNSPKPVRRSMTESLKKIEEIIQRDEGKRGIAQIFPTSNDDLLNSAHDMIKSNKVAIITGFPCLLSYNPPTETDGPLGALAIAKALLVMGKEVRVLTDECNEEVVLACAAGSNLEKYLKNGSLILESFPSLDNFDPKDEERLNEISNSIDLVVAIERAGPNANGKYHTMRCRDMTSIVAPLELLLEPSPDALQSSTRLIKTRINSIGIGDGGNEVGMGKVYDSIIKSSIPNAADIACVVAANNLIVASVSNWGGYGLAAATAVVFANQRQLPLDSTLTEFLPSDLEEVNKCKNMVAAGARDGITAENAMMVDGMPFSETLRVLAELRDVA